MAWTHNETQVYSANSPATWTDLDLSAVVGSQRVLVLLKISDLSGNGNIYYFRPNGDSGDWSTAYHVSCGGVVLVAPPIVKCCVLTDSNGVIEWDSFAQENTQIDTLGYLDNIVYKDQQVYSGDIPLTETDLDLSGAVGSNKAFVFLRQEHSSGTARSVGYRRNGLTKTYNSADDANTSDGCSEATIDGNGVGGFLTSTDENGLVEFSALDGANDYKVKVLAYNTADWHEKNVVVLSGMPSLGLWDAQDVDISSEAGAIQTLVFLSLEPTPVNGEEFIFHVGPDGDIGGRRALGGCSLARKAWITAADAGIAFTVIAETDSSGVIQLTETGVQGVVAGSVVSHSNFASPQEQNQDISFSINNSNPGIDSTTIDVTLTDPTGTTHAVIVNGIVQATYVGTIVANGSNGFDISITTYPDIVGPWIVDVYAEDFFDQSITDSWRFLATDSVPPYSPISFGLRSDALVDSATIDLTLTNPESTSYDVIVDGVFQPGYTGTITSDGGNGFDVLLNGHPDFAPTGVWTGDIYAEDALAQTITATWDFAVSNARGISFYREISTGVYSEYSPYSKYNTSAIESNYDGELGGSTEQKLFVRADDEVLRYRNIKVRAESLAQPDDVIGTSTGWGVKLKYGPVQPTEQQWEQIDYGNEIGIPQIGSIGSADSDNYVPFWMRIDCPAGAPPQVKENIVLVISFQALST
jgi:hypothetical protein